MAYGLKRGASGGRPCQEQQQQMMMQQQMQQQQQQQQQQQAMGQQQGMNGGGGGSGRVIVKGPGGQQQVLSTGVQQKVGGMMNLAGMTPQQAAQAQARMPIHRVCCCVRSTGEAPQNRGFYFIFFIFFDGCWW